MSEETIVIYRLGSLGDTVVALPCFHLIERFRPDARRVVLTNFPVSSIAAPLEAVLGNSGLIHEAIPYPLGLRSIPGLLSLAQQVRALNSSMLIYLAAPRGRMVAWRDWLFFRLIGFRSVVGVPFTQDQQVCRSVMNYDGTTVLEQECERLMRCLSELGTVDLGNRDVWDLRLANAELTRGDQIAGELGSTGPYIAINLGGKVMEKDWGLDNWKALVRWVAEQFPGLAILAVGAPEDASRVTELMTVFSGTLVNACGKLSPRESAAAMRNARLFVGHDSGPLHLAAAMGVACVGLFGNYNKPRRWHPYGQGHRILHNMAGINAISLVDVQTAILGVLPVPNVEDRKGKPGSTARSWLTAFKEKLGLKVGKMNDTSGAKLL